jgi:type II restriction enzyme
MAVNRDKPGKWKADIVQSVDMYNDWFMKFAPKAFRETRIQTTKDVEATLRWTSNLTNIQPATIRKHPEILPTLRMSTCPPLAVDRIVGLARVSANLVKCMELDTLILHQFDKIRARNFLHEHLALIKSTCYKTLKNRMSAKA